MMIFKHAIAIAAAVLLVACGGGSSGEAGSSPFGTGSGTGTGGTGGTGGSTTGAAALTLQLQDSGGTPLATPAITGTQNAVIVAHLVDDDGAAVPNTLVTFTNTGLTMTPASGQTITDATGVARIQIRATDPFASGAASVTAAGSVAGTAVDSTIAIGLGAATASLAALSVSATTVPAYQTIQVSVPATLSTGGAAAQYPVTFTSSCGSFDPPTATTDSAGVARTAYRNQAGTNAACSGTQTLTATAGTSAVTTDVTTQAPVAANLVFVQAVPTRIYLVGTPGVSQSLLTFKLVDSNNNPVQGQNVDLSLTLKPTGTYLGSNPGTTSLQQPTNSDGTVQVAVNAGAQPGPVQVQATLSGNTTITNVSNNLSVASGLPVQHAFSLSVSKYNIEAWAYDGITTDVTLRIADRLGNPVPDGTVVNFITEGGQIVASCATAGASTSDTASCTVKLSSQSPRPPNGRLTVLAWAQGEETFTDQGAPTNNVYDTGETFTDLGQPFLDKNEDGLYDLGGDVTVGTASGSTACPGGALSVPSTCNGAWGSALVRQNVVITFSDSTPILSNTSLTRQGNRCYYAFTAADLNANPLPVDTVLTVPSVKGGGDVTTPDATFDGFAGGDKIPNTSQAGGTSNVAVFTGCADDTTLTFKLTFTTPRKATSFFLP